MLKQLKKIDTEDERPSKTRRKKEMTALQDLGEELAELNDSQLAEVPIPERLREAIVEAKRISQHGGKKRQMQYVGRLMREIDAGPVREKLASWKGVSREATALLHRVERWIQAVNEYEIVSKEFRSSRLARGSAGQPVLSPLAGYLATLEATLSRAEAELGMTPMARLKLGIAYGQAKLTADALNHSLDETAEQPAIAEVAEWEAEWREA